MFKCLFLNFLAKILFTSSPLYLKYKLFFRTSIHSMPIRNTNTLAIPKHRTAMFQRSFSYQGPKQFNALTPDLKQTALCDLRFKFALRKHVLSLQRL
nr:unnamed protein product [Callosobruchus analis]